MVWFALCWEYQTWCSPFQALKKASVPSQPLELVLSRRVTELSTSQGHMLLMSAP